MRKRILLAITMALSLGINAQQIRYGIKSGSNFSTFNVKNDGLYIDDNKGSANNLEGPRIAFHVGGFAEIKFTESFAIQTELLYSRQGANYKDENSKVKSELNYITLPVLAKYMFLDKWHALLGPQLGFLANAKSEVKKEGKPNQKSDIGNQVNDMDFGFNVGVGYTLKNIGLFFEGRYYHGLVDLVEDNIGDSKSYHDRSRNAMVTNKVFQISIGYFLD